MSDLLKRSGISQIRNEICESSYRIWRIRQGVSRSLMVAVKSENGSRRFEKPTSDPRCSPSIRKAIPERKRASYFHSISNFCFPTWS